MIAVVTNIDPEHLDHYGSYEALQDAFAAFCNRVPFWGAAVLCLDHPGVQAILPRINRRTIRYGTSSQADWIASEIARDDAGPRVLGAPPRRATSAACGCASRASTTR